MAGCDYLRGGFRGFGLKKAVKFCTTTLESIKRENPELTVDNPETLSVLLSHLPNIDDAFRAAFMSAEHTFKHQKVYNPMGKCIQPFTPLPEIKPNATDEPMNETSTIVMPEIVIEIEPLNNALLIQIVN